MSDQQDDEIDLIELFMTLWEGKVTIILITCAFLAGAFGYLSLTTGLVKGATEIREASSANFVKYENFNAIAARNNFRYAINGDLIFDTLVGEFGDYDEVGKAIEETDIFIKRTQGLDTIESYKNKLKLAKKFKIVPNEINITKSGRMTYEWTDQIEATLIFQKAMVEIYENLKNGLMADVEKIALAMEQAQVNQKKVLEAEARSIQKIALQGKISREFFLQEQAAIARELKIADNMLDESGLSQSQRSTLSLNINGSEIPFYLRGYRAIEKELDILSNRSEEENLLQNAQYLRVSAKIVELESDLSVEQIRATKVLIEQDDLQDWVVYDLNLADVEPLRKSSLILALSLVLGGFLGMAYVLIRRAVQNHKSRQEAA